MNYLNKFIESDSFAGIARTIITTAEHITFAVIDEEMKIRWVNDHALSLAGKPRAEVLDTDYLSWYENDREITEHQFAQAREKGLSENIVATSTSGAYVRRRIFKIEGGYLSVCIDFSTIADARQRTRDIDTTIKVLTESKGRLVRDAQLLAIDMMDAHCQSLCKYYEDNDTGKCPPLQKAKDEILEGRPYLKVPLTNAELNVARLIREGKTRKEVAARLGISENTVRNHSTFIRRKCRIKKREM